MDRKENIDPKKSKSIPISRQMMLAVKGPRYYGELLKNNTTGSTIGYFILLVCTVVLFIYIIPAVGTLIGVGGVENYIKKAVPEFKLSDGSFEMEESVDYSNDTIRLFVNTEKEKFTQKSVNDQEIIQIYISKSNMIVYNGVTLSEIRFEDLGNVVFEKNDLIKAVPLIYIFMLLMLIAAFVVRAFVLAASIAFYALLGTMIYSMYGKKVKFSRCFCIVLYAITLGTFLESFNISAGELFPVYVISMISTVITVIFMSRAMQADLKDPESYL